MIKSRTYNEGVILSIIAALKALITRVDGLPLFRDQIVNHIRTCVPAWISRLHGAIDTVSSLVAC
jgi:hypothetical protein